MKVLLLEDVINLGLAGDVVRVADGYGRNYLVPRGLAKVATPGALKQADQIRTQANAKRAVLNEEMSSVAEALSELTLTFPVKAGETGKLYGSITPVMIAEAIKDKTGVDIGRRQLDFEPIRTLGTHQVDIRLTIDLVPQITVIVYREGETPEMMLAELEALAEAEALAEEEALEEETAEEETAEEEAEAVEAQVEGDTEATE